MDARIHGTETSFITAPSDHAGHRHDDSGSAGLNLIPRSPRHCPAPGLPGARLADRHARGKNASRCFAARFPKPTLYTLIHRRARLARRSNHGHLHLAVPAIPGVFRYYRHLLPIMPLAARAWRLKDVDLVISLSHCVAKAVVPPPGVPHVCYCFTPMDAMPCTAATPTSKAGPTARCGGALAMSVRTRLQAPGRRNGGPGDRFHRHLRDNPRADCPKRHGRESR